MTSLAKFHQKNLLRLTFIFALLLGVVLKSKAVDTGMPHGDVSDSENQLYKIKWGEGREVLTVQNCGCEGACFVAELRNKKKNDLKVRLRCDCQSVHVTQGNAGIEKRVADSCQKFSCKGTGCKSKLIAQELKKWIH